MTPVVKEQILTVCDTCKTNMFDINAVIHIAYNNDWCELAAWLSDQANHKEYCRFIFIGEAIDQKELKQP